MRKTKNLLVTYIKINQFVKVLEVIMLEVIKNIFTYLNLYIIFIVKITSFA